LVRVDRAEDAAIPREAQLVLDRVSRQSRVVGLDVELEAVEQIVLLKEGETGAGIGVVLVFRGFPGLRLDEELTGEAYLLGVVDRKVEEAPRLSSSRRISVLSSVS